MLVSGNSRNCARNLPPAAAWSCAGAPPFPPVLPLLQTEGLTALVGGIYSQANTRPGHLRNTKTSARDTSAKRDTWQVTAAGLRDMLSSSTTKQLQPVHQQPSHRLPGRPALLLHPSETCATCAAVPQTRQGNVMRLTNSVRCKQGRCTNSTAVSC